MQDLIKKISAVLMAFVVMFSTMSFSMNQHFCGDTLVDTAFFSEAKSCGMEMKSTTTRNECSIEKKDCCSDEVKRIDGQNELKTQNLKLEFNQQVFLVSFVYSYTSLFEDHLEDNLTYRKYKPPLITRDFQALHSVFLI